jgi:TRAP transporter TAXI family solute receptor
MQTKPLLSNAHPAWRRGAGILAAGFALLLAACAGTPPASLELATGAAGGAFAEYGPKVGALITDITGIEIRERATGGSVDNVKLLEAGSVALGLVNMGPAFEAWNGSEAWTAGKKMRNLRALFPMYETPFHVAALKASGITTLRGLDGKRVGVGPAGGPAELIFRALAAEVGIKTTIVTGSPSDMAKQVLSRQIDAFWFGSGLPLTAFVDIDKAAPAVIFALTETEVAALRKRFPYMAPNTIPASTYASQKTPLTTAALWNFVVANKDLGDDDAYAITKAVLGNPWLTTRLHPAAKATIGANAAANTFMTFHPGALRYYREAGIAIPSALAP